MFKFFETLFKKGYGLGAFGNVDDTRDIPLNAVQAPVTDLPDEHITDITHLPVLNQGWLGTCVAHSLVLIKQYLDFKETGQVYKLSRRFLYAVTRKTFGYSEDMGQGLYPRDAAKILTDIGTIDDDSKDDNTLPHAQYVNEILLTEELKKKAEPFKTKGYAFVELNALAFMSALIQNDVMALSVDYDSSTWLGGFIRKIKQILGFHYIVLYGYKKEGNDIRFYFRNSWSLFWGFKGNGEFLWSEYDGHCRDAMVFVDLPNDLIERARQNRYVFLRNLSYGSSGDDVRELQKRLKEYGYFNYSGFTTYFGEKTREALKQYQVNVGISPTGNFYNLTRAAMNEDKRNVKAKSKLDLWCDAITKMEGASAKLNNPGNIKYVGQKTATGKDYRGFCIFPDFATGYMELRNMLIRAATPPDTIYKASMTLVQFYHVYAPSADDNNPDHYAKFVAKYIGVTPETKISELL